MSSKSDKIYGNDAVLYLAITVAGIAYIYEIATALMNKSWIAAGKEAFAFILLMALLAAFWKHEKNAMKVLMGGLITYLLYVQGNKLFLGITQYQNSGSSDNASLNFAMFSACVTTVLFFVLFINYLALSSYSYNIKRRTILNKVILSFLIVFYILGIIHCIVKGTVGRFLSTAIIQVSLLLTIVTIETKLNMYKTVREQLIADEQWNEEQKKNLKKEVFGE